MVLQYSAQNYEFPDAYAEGFINNVCQPDKRNKYHTFALQGLIFLHKRK
jgi:hypothetical protein